MLDEYRRGYVERISPEAPVPVLNLVSRDFALGGAGNVVNNLRQLDVKVTVVGVLGKDDTSDRISNELRAIGVADGTIVTDPERVSTRKVRYVSVEHGQQVFRADEESVREVSGTVENAIMDQIRENVRHATVVVCSDYLKGVLTGPILKVVFASASELGLPVIVAPKSSEAMKYRGADILMPNARELARLVGTPMDGDVWLTTSSAQLMHTLGLQALLVTRSKEGMTLFQRQDSSLRRADIPAVARNVYDVTGAGDTALAAFSAGIAAGASLEAAAQVANVAAGVVIAKRGTGTVTAREIIEHLIEQEHADTGEASGNTSWSSVS